MRIRPEIDGVDIVLVGDFNPAIFTPAWFVLHDLLPDSDAANAELVVAHKEMTQFRTEWLHFKATLDRFEVETLQAPHVRVHDLVVRVFSENLHHTPLRAFGINRRVHFLVRFQAVRDRLGETLAPLEPWGSWVDELGLDEPDGGMTALTMSRVNPPDRDLGGEININVEPSKRVGAEAGTGVYVGVNDHFALDASGPGNAVQSMQLFSDRFAMSISRSDKIIDHIMSIAADGSSS